MKSRTHRGIFTSITGFPFHAYGNNNAVEQTISSLNGVSISTPISGYNDKSNTIRDYLPRCKIFSKEDSTPIRDFFSSNGRIKNMRLFSDLNVNIKMYMKYYHDDYKL